MLQGTAKIMCNLLTTEIEKALLLCSYPGKMRVCVYVNGILCVRMLRCVLLMNNEQKSNLMRLVKFINTIGSCDSINHSACRCVL